MATRKPSRSKAVAVKAIPKQRTTRSVPKTARPKQAAADSPYAVHPGVAMVQKWIAELAAKTGRSLEEWIEHIQASGPPAEKDRRLWLKEKYHLGTNVAGWLAGKSLGSALGLAEDSPESYLRAAPLYVVRMYAGPRAGLKPIHDELIRLAKTLGDDVRICPCKTIVPLYRRHVFAELKPATSKRLDLGFALGEEPFTGRLLDTGGAAKKARITHRVGLHATADIDLQVKRWLKQAYERDK